MLKAINKRFQFRSVRGDNLPWASPRGTRETLADLYCDLGYTRGAEIGTRIGSYSKVLCQRNSNLKLYCIDPYIAYGRLKQKTQDDYYEKAKRRLAEYDVHMMRTTSMDALEHFEDNSLDFIFIDGNHEFDFVMMDIICWAKKVKKGGIMSVHDYLNFYRAGIVKAVDAYTHCNRISPWFVTKEQLPTAFWVNP